MRMKWGLSNCGLLFMLMIKGKRKERIAGVFFSYFSFRVEVDFHKLAKNFMSYDSSQSATALHCPNSCLVNYHEYAARHFEDETGILNCAASGLGLRAEGDRERRIGRKEGMVVASFSMEIDVDFQISQKFRVQPKCHCTVRAPA